MAVDVDAAHAGRGRPVQVDRLHELAGRGVLPGPEDGAQLIGPMVDRDGAALPADPRLSLEDGHMGVAGLRQVVRGGQAAGARPDHADPRVPAMLPELHGPTPFPVGRPRRTQSPTHVPA